MLVVFDNGSTYDYTFVIKMLAKEFKGQFECLGINTEKYITLSVPIYKKLHNGKSNKYKIKFIDTFRLMQNHYQVLLNIYQKEFIVIIVQIVNFI